jgi:hypothetical protein
MAKTPEIPPLSTMRLSPNLLHPIPFLPILLSPLRPDVGSWKPRRLAENPLLPLPLSIRHSLFAIRRHLAARCSLFLLPFPGKKRFFGKIWPIRFDRDNFRVYIYTKTSEHSK